MQSVNDNKPLYGRSAIVTGGGAGLGADMARALAQQGAAVCIADQNPDRARRIAEEISETGGTAFGWQADISNRFQVSAMIETTRDRYQRLDIVVNQAHLSPNTDALQIDEWSVRRVLEVNLVGTYFCAQLAARVMADEGGGLIAFVYRTPNSDESTALVQATQQALVTLADGLSRAVDPRVMIEAIPANQDTIQTILTLGATLPSENGSR